MDTVDHISPTNTGDHAARLLGIVAAVEGGSDEQIITCRPKMLSCDPVSQCVDFSSPGCEPLETIRRGADSRGKPN